tara:strand:- start:1003 stop:1137 length:135 start_codon:yes stop_codon:yes gene_type:complete
MIKKFSIIIFVAILTTSCGKKGDPVYNEKNQSTKIPNVSLSALS